MGGFIAGISRAGSNGSVSVTETFGGYRVNKRYNVRHLERFRWDSYRDAAERLEQITEKTPVPENLSSVLDMTGYGREQIEGFEQRGLNSVLVIRTGENDARSEDNVYYLPEKKLVTDVQALLITEQLRIDPDLELAEVLEKKIVRYPKEPETLETQFEKASKEGLGYELVFSVAVACWWGQKNAEGKVNIARNR